MQDITSKEYWNKRYEDGMTGWDMGNVSPPLKEYFDQLTDKSIKILIPGAGNAWEVEYLHNSGFSNVYLLDFAEKSIENFESRCPNFPKNHLIHQDFFAHNEKYDLIIEQTFFSSFHPKNRQRFVDQINKLLYADGKYVGLLFNHGFDFQGPPFGGTPRTYFNLFKKEFNFKHFETAYNSIKPREERELFILLAKK